MFQLFVWFFFFTLRLQKETVLAEKTSNFLGKNICKHFQLKTKIFPPRSITALSRVITTLLPQVPAHCYGLSHDIPWYMLPQGTLHKYHLFSVEREIEAHLRRLTGQLGLKRKMACREQFQWKNQYNFFQLKYSIYAFEQNTLFSILHWKKFPIRSSSLHSPNLLTNSRSKYTVEILIPVTIH